jgi:hypothetical protein
MSEKRGIDDMDVRDCMYISNGLKIQNGGKIILDLSTNYFLIFS